MHINTRYLTAHSPTTTHIALATKAKLFDPTFSTTSTLCVYDHALHVYSNTLESEYRYNRLLFCSDDILVGGTENGYFEMYQLTTENNNETNGEKSNDEKSNEKNNEKNNESNDNNISNENNVESIAENKKTDNITKRLVLTRIYQNTTILNGDILGLAYNATKRMLALGSSKSKLFLLNTNNLKPYTCGITTNLHNITAIAWNPKVSHILAIGNDQGELVILDLKQKKEVMRLCKLKSVIRDVYWSREKHTGLVVVSDGLYRIDLESDSMVKVCEDVECVRFIDIINTGNSCDEYEMLVAGKERIALLDSLGNVKVDVRTGPVFDIQVSEGVKDRMLSISYLNNRTEIVKLDSFLGKHGYFHGTSESRNVFCIAGRRVVTLDSSKKVNMYKIKVKEDVISNIFKDDVISGVISLVEGCKTESISLDKLLADNFRSNEKNIGMNVDESDEVLMSILKKDYQSIKNSEVTEIPLIVLTSLISHNGSKDMFSVPDDVMSGIKDIRALFLISSLTNNYTNIVNNISINQWYILAMYNKDPAVLLDIANRLNTHTNGMKREAMICYLIAGAYKEFINLRTSNIRIGSIKEYIQFVLSYKHVLDECKKLGVKTSGDLLKEYVNYKIFCGDYEDVKECVEENDEYGTVFLNRMYNTNNTNSTKNTNNKKNTKKGNVGKIVNNTQVSYNQKINTPSMMGQGNINQAKPSQVNINQMNQTNQTNQMNNSQVNAKQEADRKVFNPIPRITPIPPMNNMSMNNVSMNKNIIPNSPMNNSNPAPINGMPRNPMSTLPKKPVPTINTSMKSPNTLIPGYTPTNNQAQVINQALSNTSLKEGIPKKTYGNTYGQRNAQVGNLGQGKVNSEINSGIYKHPQGAVPPSMAPSSRLSNPVSPAPVIPLMNVRANINNTRPGVFIPPTQPNINKNDDSMSISTPTMDMPSAPGFTQRYHQQPSNTNVSNESNTAERQETLVHVSEKIDFLKVLASQKKGILFKSKINSALKRIEVYDMKDKKLFTDNFVGKLNLLFQLISINEIESAILNNELGMVKEKVYGVFRSNAEDMVREFGGCNGVEIFVPGFVGLLQVVLSDKLIK